MNFGPSIGRVEPGETLAGGSLCKRERVEERELKGEQKREKEGK